MAHSEPRAVARLRSQRGFTLVDLVFVIGLIGLLSTLAVPGLMRARGAANSSSAVASIRVINSAELSYAISCGLGFYAPSLVPLGVPPPTSATPFLTRDLSSAATVNRSGYQFRLVGSGLSGAPPSCNGVPAGQGAPGYKLIADPLDASNPKFFASNSSGLLYQHSASMFASMPESGPSAVGMLAQ